MGLSTCLFRGARRVDKVTSEQFKEGVTRGTMICSPCRLREEEKTGILEWLHANCLIPGTLYRIRQESPVSQHSFFFVVLFCVMLTDNEARPRE
jgi:hypothetical protein